MIKAKSSLDFNFEFSPKLIGSHEFYLPILMNGIRTDLRPESSSSARATWDRVTPARLVVAETAQPTVQLRIEGGQGPNANWENEITLSPSQAIAVFFLKNISDVKSDFIFQANSSFDLSEYSFCLNPGEERQMKIKSRHEVFEFGTNTINFVENGAFSYEIKLNFINDQEGFLYSVIYCVLPVYFRSTSGSRQSDEKLYKPNIEFHPDELYLETVPLDTFVKGYFTIQTTNLGFEVLNRPPFSNWLVQKKLFSKTQKKRISVAASIRSSKNGRW